MMMNKFDTFQKIDSLPRRKVIASTVASMLSIGLLGSSSNLLAQAISKPLPNYVNWKEPNSFIVHSNTTIETKLRHKPDYTC